MLLGAREVWMLLSSQQDESLSYGVEVSAVYDLRLSSW